MNTAETLAVLLAGFAAGVIVGVRLVIAYHERREAELEACIDNLLGEDDSDELHDHEDVKRELLGERWKYN